MGKKPEYRSTNFSIYAGKLNQFADSQDLRRIYEDYGLNGLEVIRAGESDQGKILPDMVNGVHLYFHIFWMDWWKGDYSRLDKEFDSREQWMEYFGGTDRNIYLDNLRADLQYAEQTGAKYVVFHVAEVTLRESYLYQYRYTDEEVIDASLEIINTLLDEREYPFDFLVENLWWSGLDLRDVMLTRKLVEGMHTKRKGIMLDTGHYMNTNFSLRTPEDAVACLNALADTYEAEGMLHWFKGMHLQMSLGGEYAEQQKKDWKEHPLDFDAIPFYDLFSLAYAHACNIDQHKPFIGRGVKEFVERMHPQYITLEFENGDRETIGKYLEMQSRELGWKKG